MLMGDLSESCSSRVVESYTPITTKNRRQREKADIYHEVLRRLKELDVEEVKYSGFEDDLWAHFNRLPLRYAVYALDMNIEKAEDVLMHKRLLQMARDPATRPAVEVRLVVQASSNGTSGEPIPSNILRKMDDQLSGSKDRDGAHPPTAFKFPSHLEAAFERTNLHVQDTDGSLGSDYSSYSGPRHEITISTNDKPKFLSQLTSLMSGLGLNIREAHAFSTGDGYSLDVFVVDSWKDEETEELRASLVKEIQIIEEFTSKYGDCIIYKSSQPYASQPSLQKSQSIKHQISCKANEPELVVFKCGPKNGCTNNEGTDFWEIDTNVLRFEKKIASGSYGDLYRGTYRSQDVAVKVFRTENLNKTAQQEFAQEVYILRKIRHKNIVQFIGACARPPRLCIVTEYMPGGSVFDFLHKQQDVLKLATVLRWAIDVSNGMNYLHRNNIIHRDLKSANLLMDENCVVKIADFGVARVQTQPGVMTAETGTYRWMAPEVIEHKPYDHKADIFSFGILLWELVTGMLPYVELTPVQAAIGVVHKGLRPAIPCDTNPSLVKLLNRCWEHEPSLRPEFSEIVEILKNIAKTTQK